MSPPAQFVMSRGAPAAAAGPELQPGPAAGAGRPLALVVLLLLLTHGSSLLAFLSPSSQPSSDLDTVSQGGKVHVSFCTS